MRIITHICTDCGTVVSANELERRRVMKCPRFDCEAILRFEQLSDDEREHFLDNQEQYVI